MVVAQSVVDSYGKGGGSAKARAKAALGDVKLYNNTFKPRFNMYKPQRYHRHRHCHLCNYHTKASLDTLVKLLRQYLERVVTLDFRRPADYCSNVLTESTFSCCYNVSRCLQWIEEHHENMPHIGGYLST